MCYNNTKVWFQIQLISIPRSNGHQSEIYILETQADSGVAFAPLTVIFQSFMSNFCLSRHKFSSLMSVSYSCKLTLEDNRMFVFLTNGFKLFIWKIWRHGRKCAALGILIGHITHVWQLVPKKMKTFSNFSLQSINVFLWKAVTFPLLKIVIFSLDKQSKQVWFFSKYLLENILMATCYHRKGSKFGTLAFLSKKNG